MNQPLHEHPARNDWQLIVNLPFLAKRYSQFHISTIGEGESTRRCRSILKLILFAVSQLNIVVKRLRNRYQCVIPVQMLFICSRTSSLRIDRNELDRARSTQIHHLGRCGLSAVQLSRCLHAEVADDDTGFNLDSRYPQQRDVFFASTQKPAKAPGQ